MSVAQRPCSGGLAFLTGGPSVEHIQDATMGHDRDVLVEVAGSQVLDAALYARFELVQTLAAWRRPLGVSTPPSLGLGGVKLFELNPSEAFEITKVTLTQTRFNPVIEGGVVIGRQKMSRFKGSFEVAGVHARQSLVLQGQAQLSGLPKAKRVQCNVKVPLDARLNIPVGFSMSDEGDSGRVHEGLWRSLKKADLKGQMSS